MTKYISLFISILWLASCQKDRANLTENCFRQETIIIPNTSLHPETGINGSINYSYVDGNSMIFVYAEIDDCLDVFDDEKLESVVFSVSNEIGEFNLKDLDLGQISCHFESSGAKASSVITLLSQGSLQGKKITDKKWRITGNVHVPLDGNPALFKIIQIDDDFIVK
jgi:hypothetical protein